MSGWLDQAAVLEPMKIVLPRSSGRASASRTQRNALRTSVCQKTENVSQVWRRVGRCGPVAPAFRTSTRGRSRSITRAAVTGSVASAATVSTRPFTSRERGERARVARHGDDAHAGPGERLDDAAPEAAAAPGHHRRLVAKVVHGGPTP